MRKEKFIPGEYYHIYNRTIANYEVLNKEQNAKRLMQAFLFAKAFKYLRNNQPKATSDVALGWDKALEAIKQGEKLVDVVCFAIMSDHYHLLVKERKDNGTVNFIHKCDISISKYINLKSGRKGPLFESRFKSKHIDSNDYLVHLSAYIHLNPFDILVGKQWREHKLKDWQGVRQKLLGYPWSSLKIFLNEKADNDKDLIVSGQEIITDQFKNAKEYENHLKEWSTQFLSDGEFD